MQNSFFNLLMTLLDAREAIMSPFRSLLRHFNLTEQQWRMLRTLHFCGPLPIRELGEATNIPGPSASRIVSGLERGGLVARRKVPDDGRVVLIFIIPHGEDIIRSMEPHAEALFAEIVRSFHSQRVRELQALLLELQQELQMLSAVEPECGRQ